LDDRRRLKHADLYALLSLERLEELARRLAEQVAENERAINVVTGEAAAAREEVIRRLAEHVNEMTRRQEVLRAEGAEMREQLAARLEDLVRLEAEIARMRSSWMWRLLTFGGLFSRP